MKGQQEHFKRLIEDSQKSFTEAIKKLPIKEASVLNSFYHELNTIALNKDLSAKEKQNLIQIQMDKISSEYGININ